MLKTSMNAGWLGVASTVVLGALACVECYVQEAARLTAMEKAPPASVAVDVSAGMGR